MWQAKLKVAIAPPNQCDKCARRCEQCGHVKFYRGAGIRFDERCPCSSVRRFKRKLGQMNSGAAAHQDVETALGKFSVVDNRPSSGDRGDLWMAALIANRCVNNLHDRKGSMGCKAVTNHGLVARLKHVKGQNGARKKCRLRKRKKGQGGKGRFKVGRLALVRSHWRKLAPLGRLGAVSDGWFGVAFRVMGMPVDSARLAASMSRFGVFFRELEGSFAERSDVLKQLALALISKQHVLVAGPPGTAKSALARAVLGRIVDEETGRPSLYARQLTESTVQTDVIGPIDFKTLMETGRTEHFTDEGILGAVHAFLDEVFDGRDMLLRSTLNLLQERELKQGTRITQGRFEIALMTTNRYVAEVLESSRDTLLAFLDRIAFIGFVPRSFAEPSRLAAVLRHEIGGEGRPSLEAPLSVQDLDALQAFAAEVHIPEAICDGLAKLLDLFEAELSSAERSDSTFLPTRYLSTRTAVRSGEILRAICVYDAIFHRPERSLSVEPSDFAALRLHLLLSGPSQEHIGVLLQRERDPREKRQLSIVRSEREAFDRALAKLPAIRMPSFVGRKRDAPSAKEARLGNPSLPISFAAESESASNHRDSRPSAAPSLPEWAAAASAAFANGDTADIARALRNVLPHARLSSESGERAAGLVRQGLLELERQALRVTLAARATEQKSNWDVAEELASLAERFDEGPTDSQALGRVVRGRALVLLSMSVAESLGLGQRSVLSWTTQRDALTLLREAETKLTAFEKVAVYRARLAAAGVSPDLRHAAEAAWASGSKVVTEEVAALCDTALRVAATDALSNSADKGLAQLLAEVGAVLQLLRDLDARAESLGLLLSLRTKVVGPRISPILGHTFGRVEMTDRSAYTAEIDKVMKLLSAAGLDGSVAASEWLTWAAAALLRAEERAAMPFPPLDHDGYRALRASAPKVPSGYVLAEIALQVGEPNRSVLPEERGAPQRRLVSADLLSSLPPSLRRQLAASDRTRIERVIGFLERFWSAVDGGSDDPSAAAADVSLSAIVHSRFFSILLDDGAASRTLLEIELLADLFPEELDGSLALKARMDGLIERARMRVLHLVRLRGDSAWSEALRAAG